MYWFTKGDWFYDEVRYSQSSNTLSFWGLRPLVPHQGFYPGLAGGLQCHPDTLLIFFFFFFSRLWREKSPAAFHKLNLEHKMVLWQNTWKNSWPILTLTKMFRSKFCYRNYQHHLSVFNFLLFFSNHNIAN